MTEQEWLSCTSAQAMLTWLRGRGGQRKYRLFACACCWHFWEAIPDERSWQAVCIAERFADGQVTRRELTKARASCPGSGHGAADRSLARATAAAAASNAQYAALSCAEIVADTMRTAHLDEILSSEEAPHNEQTLQSLEVSYRQLADLVRHLFGNPFRPLPAEGEAALTVVQFAEALYRGEDCAFALHDALLESGQSALAEHFRDSWHPKGCWGLDWILRKQAGA